jgi:hypothetical protein
MNIDDTLLLLTIGFFIGALVRGMGNDIKRPYNTETPEQFEERMKRERREGK